VQHEACGSDTSQREDVGQLSTQQRDKVFTYLIFSFDDLFYF
jgi:hypothetical protein